VNTWEPKTWIQHKYTQLIMRVSKTQNLVHKKKSLSTPKKHAVRYKHEEKSECDY
jgi:hypothetical protein